MLVEGNKSRQETLDETGARQVVTEWRDSATTREAVRINASHTQLYNTAQSCQHSELWTTDVRLQSSHDSLYTEL
jgi:hypothetical protein